MNHDTFIALFTAGLSAVGTITIFFGTVVVKIARRIVVIGTANGENTIKNTEAINLLSNDVRHLTQSILPITEIQEKIAIFTEWKRVVEERGCAYSNKMSALKKIDS